MPSVNWGYVVVVNVPNKTDEVTVGYVRVVLETAEELGYDLQDSLDQLGIGKSHLYNKSNHITYQQQLDIVEAAVGR